MAMAEASPSAAGAFAFTLQWGVMMTAMMLPSAMPMILLYRTVSLQLSTQEVRAIPVLAFAAVYLFMWLLTGLPVYLMSVALLDVQVLPYFVANTLIIAGIYQLTPLKRACLRACESPLGFLMRRWRGGYLATFKIAVQHAAFCIGCCWALMVILVAAGAMSLPWVLGITLLVFAEKVLPHGWRTAQVIGIALILLGIAVAVRPELSMLLRPAPTMSM